MATVASVTRSVEGLVRRTHRAVHRHGPRGVLTMAVGRFAHWAHRNEEHFWWEKDLTVDDAPRPMPEGLRMVRLPESEAARVENLPLMNMGVVRARFRAGAELWAALHGEQVAFAVWVFPHLLPVHAARGGWVPLPARTIGLEDGATAPEFRRTNVAFAALVVIADHHRARGAQAIMAKTATDNRPVFMLFARSGFRRVATMHTRFRGPLRRIRITDADGPNAGSLAATLVPPRRRRY